LILTGSCLASPINVAASANGGFASQSSNYDISNYPASNGNNGALGDFSHTLLEPQAWWQVVFDNSYYISSITVNNRTSCCETRINPFSVFLYNSSNSVVWSSVGNTIDLPATLATFSVPDVLAVRLRVQLNRADYLHVAEVQAIGDTVSSAAVPEPSSILLLASGLAAGVWFRRRAQQHKH